MLLILRTVVLAGVWVALCALLALLFAFAYNQHIPVHRHVVDLHLDYSAQVVSAHAAFTPMLKAGQEYEARLEMDIPDIANAHSGNFMVVSRFGHGPKTLASSTRPGLVGGRSGLVEAAYKAVRLPLYLANLLEERRCVRVDVLGSLVESPSTPLTNFALELRAGRPSGQVPETFAVRLVLIAKLSWLQSFLRTWRAPLFVLFVLFGASGLTLAVAGYLFYRQVLLAAKEDDTHGAIVRGSEERLDSESIEKDTVVYSESESESESSSNLESEHLVPLL